MSHSKARLLLSATFAFLFYFTWTYLVNRGPEIEPAITLRAALVQGTYSGAVTLGFTFILELLVEHFGAHCFSLAFMTPILSTASAKTAQAKAIGAAFNHALNKAADFFQGARIPGALVAPLLPLSVQTIAVVSVHWLNRTPNLLLTVSPSILFTGLYGYLYTFSLLRKKRERPVPAD
ncbi:MAG: hypothetical protein Q7Q71_04335 [Verrucomicrobiota bacterium JB023]|nr:hypothetical protein [Verrucomicrobiota bacterium JB023]